jgi:hypothetical protein
MRRLPIRLSVALALSGHRLRSLCRLNDSNEKSSRSKLEARGMPLGLMPQMSYEEKESVLV